MNKTNSKIAKQSRIALTNALFKTMEIYDFKEITVTQIAQEAKLSRKTFYRLFSDKEEILNSFLKNKIDLFFDMLKQEQIHNYWQVVTLYFNFWAEHKSLIKLLKKNNLLSMLYEISYRYSFEAFEIVRTKEIASNFIENLPYLLAYSIGGMHSMLVKWVDDDMTTSPEKFIADLKKGLQANNI